MASSVYGWALRALGGANVFFAVACFQQRLSLGTSLAFLAAGLMLLWAAGKPAREPSLTLAAIGYVVAFVAALVFYLEVFGPGETSPSTVAMDFYFVALAAGPSRPYVRPPR